MGHVIKKDKRGCGFVVVKDILTAVKNCRVISLEITLLTVVARLFNMCANVPIEKKEKE